MKKIIIFLFALVLLSGCGPKEEPKVPQLEVTETKIVEPAAALIQEINAIKDFSVDQYFSIGYNMYDLLAPKGVDLSDLAFKDLDGNPVSLQNQKSFIFAYDLRAMPIDDDTFKELFDYLYADAYLTYPEYNFYLLNLGFDQELNMQFLSEELGYEFDHSMVIEPLDQEAYYGKYEAETFYYAVFVDDGIVEAGVDNLITPFGFDEIFRVMTLEESPLKRMSEEDAQALTRNWLDVKVELLPENVKKLEELCTHYFEDVPEYIDAYKEMAVIRPIGQQLDLADLINHASANEEAVANLDNEKVIVYNYRGYEFDYDEEILCGEIAHLATFISENPSYKLCVLVQNGLYDQAKAMLELYEVDPTTNLFEITYDYPEALIVSDMFRYSAGLFLDEEGYVAAGLPYTFGTDEYTNMNGLNELAYGEVPLYICK